MDTLLLLFALPVATIILAIVLQKILKCPLLVAVTVWAIFLIVTYAAFDSSFLVYTILYTILAYVTAVLVRLICNIISRFNLNNSCCDSNCLCNQNNNNGRSVVSNETWCCTNRNTGNNVARIGISTTNGLNSQSCACESNNDVTITNNSSNNDPIIILSNGNNIRNMQRRNCCCQRR